MTRSCFLGPSFFYFILTLNAHPQTLLIFYQTLLNMDQPDNITGNVFADDFRRIRESRKISIAELSRTTLVTADILEEFERSALLGHPRFNTVYLKAFVRTLAEALNIPKEVAVSSLEEMLQGQYSGALKGFINPESVVIRSAPTPKATPKTDPVPAVPLKTLTETPTKPIEEKVASTKARKPSKARAEKEEPIETSLVVPTDTPSPLSNPKPSEVPSIASSPEASESKSFSPEAQEPANPVKLAIPPPPPKEPETASSVVPKTQPIVFDDTRGIRPSAPPIRNLESDSDGINWFKILVPIAILAVLGVFVWFIYSEWKSAGSESLLADSNAANTTQEPTTSPNTNTDIDSNTSKPSTNGTVLPDSFMVSILSVDKPISGMKLTPDAKPRFPVWVELGDTLNVKIKNQPLYVKQSLKLEGGLRNARIIVQGKAFTIPGADSLQVATLSRDMIAKLIGQ